ncbi:MAG: hypothetical protein WA364_27090 [Candidatus Nitrosopolaris sp.]
MKRAIPRTIEASYVPIFIIIVSLVSIIPTGPIITANNHIGTSSFAYGQASQTNSNNANSINIQNIPAKKVHVILEKKP